MSQTIRDAAGAALATKAAVEGKTTTNTQETVRTFTEDVYQTFTGTGRQGEQERRLLFKAGQVVRQREIDALFPTPRVDAIEPAAGGTAAGQFVTISGINFEGATGAQIDGVALTNFRLVDSYTITGNKGVNTVGAKTVTVLHPAGNATKAAAYTVA